MIGANPIDRFKKDQQCLHTTNERSRSTMPSCKVVSLVLHGGAVIFITIQTLAFDFGFTAYPHGHSFRAGAFRGTDSKYIKLAITH